MKGMPLRKNLKCASMGDRLAETTYIQRVQTSGGSMPTTGCAKDADVRQRAFVPYTADYVFYKATWRK